MKYFILEAEVAGGWGPKTVADTSVHPPIVKKLHYEFEGWSGDCVVQSFPCYLVTDSVGSELLKNKLSGFNLAPVEVTTSDIFQELHPSRVLPKFSWLKVDGKPGVDDFGISEKHTLVVSERALKVLQEEQLRICEIKNWHG